MAYEVTERNGWSYVAGPDGVPPDSGPWRYAWEAQEYADELNRGVGAEFDSGFPRENVLAPF